MHRISYLVPLIATALLLGALIVFGHGATGDVAIGFAGGVATFFGGLAVSKDADRNTLNEHRAIMEEIAVIRQAVGAGLPDSPIHPALLRTGDNAGPERV